MSNRLPLRLLAFSIALTITIAYPLGAQIDAQRANVVLLRASAGDGTTETAAGLYVGQDPAYAYFVTALHPLLKNGSDPVDQVKVRFFSGPAEFTGRVLDRFSTEKDLAVVSLPVDDLPVGLVKMHRRDATSGLAIHILGHPPAASWASWTGAVENEKEVGGAPEFFSTGSDQSLTHGFSGGPVFDGSGTFIGMHLKASVSAARNLKSSVIVSSLQAWHVPISNVISGDVDFRRFAIAKEIISGLSQDDISAVRSQLSASVSEQLSNQQIRSVWSVATGILGNYVSNLSQSKRVVASYTLYVIKARFQRGNAELRLSFDSTDAVAGIWLITVGDHPPSDLVAAAKNIVDELVQHQYQAVLDAFSASVKAGYTVDVIANAWNTVLATKGNFVQQTEAQKSSEADFVDVRCHFAGGDIIVRVSFAPSMEVTGVNLLAAP